MMDRINAALEGRYHIERELGEGGMATVYLAEDLKHDRQVAIKVLKPELAAVVGAERFLAEIKTTAQLQHPHILPLHDSGEADGFLFYVMPYVEGESLRERLDREHQLPVEQAVELSHKIADALDYAHDRGVVHRDVKPANVLLSPRGEPLVSDFGIALALSEAGEGRITETGLSLGTPHYMSPEQASGERTVDRRTDVYALGCVLYEMLVGEPPYAGPTAQAVLGKILTAEPGRISDARRAVPTNVDDAVWKAIQKTPADRFESARAFSEALAEPGFRAAVSPGRSGIANRPTALRRAVLAIVAIIVVAGGTFLAGRSTAPAPEGLLARFRVSVPEGVMGVSRCCGPAQALSPDGQWLVFVGVGTAGDPLFRRRLGELNAEVLPRTQEARIPFFSPDSRWIGFHADGRLQKVPVSGGPPVPIVEEPEVNGASWGDDDVIVYAVADEGLYTVPAAGGTPEAVPGTDHGDYIQPWVLPGGGAALVRIQNAEAAEDAGTGVVDLETGRADTLGAATRAAYASGHLLLSTADGTLLAQPFDAGARRTTGPAVAILDGVNTNNPPSLGEFAVSRNGGLVYQTGGTGLAETLVIRDESGASPIPLTEPGNLEDPAFSPDGRRIAVRVRPTAESGQIWIWDRDQRTQQLLTVEGEDNRAPTWSPDGSRIAFARQRETGSLQIYGRAADGSGVAEALYEPEGGAYPSDFSPDGRSLVIVVWDTGEDADIGMLDLEDGTVEWLVQTSADDYQGRLSPDGRWLAYTSERSGRPEVYVQAVDGTGGRTKVSAGGGHSPRWGPDATTLYFGTGEDGEGEAVIAASVRADGRFEVLDRREAFEGPQDVNVTQPSAWDVSRDGREFVYIGRPDQESAPRFVWVLNWPRMVREMAGGDSP